MGADVRIHLDDQGDPWFMATDVCSNLGVQYPTDALTRLDEDQKSTLASNEGGGARPASTTLAVRLCGAKRVPRCRLRDAVDQGFRSYLTGASRHPQHSKVMKAPPRLGCLRFHVGHLQETLFWPSRCAVGLQKISSWKGPQAQPEAPRHCRELVPCRS